ncbi:hypothetical protein PF010_g9752 [Phytophthora fragariae]|uniref:Uncharacterized protein n=1 Tax=Phytophthora fragariae TaxID=53985 RepID=A0A6A3LYL9_9STRA|nr:hypothetical protein PF011_g4059 [Phytophthora fragariae]KAE9114297.1 hypothetical protein PF010_g9752 [Phytophthora fragariae]KAE9234515.1 hypothetical protein PF004_g9361 [Phytophthora fragariae]
MADADNTLEVEDTISQVQHGPDPPPAFPDDMIFAPSADRGKASRNIYDGGYVDIDDEEEIDVGDTNDNADISESCSTGIGGEERTTPKLESAAEEENGNASEAGEEIVYDEELVDYSDLDDDAEM